jgi:hypothetical protein
MSRNSIILSQTVARRYWVPFVVKLSVNDGAGIQTKFVAIDSKAVLVGLKFSKIVLGGTAASHTRSGVGGGDFFARAEVFEDCSRGNSRLS